MPNDTPPQNDAAVAETPDRIINRNLGIAADKLAEFRRGQKLHAQPREKDLKLLDALIHGSLRLPENLDIGESEASKSLNGHATDGQNFQLYCEAQSALLCAFQTLHGRKANPTETARLGKIFAYIARGLIELQEGAPLEVVHVRNRINAVLELAESIDRII